MQADEEALESFGLYTGIEDPRKALDSAMRYWNAFWGPLGSQDITKKTLIDNRDLVFTMVAATSESLIRDRIRASEECSRLHTVLNLQRRLMLELYQHLVSLYPAEVVSFSAMCDQLLDDLRPLDDVDGFAGDRAMPRWVLLITLPTGARPLLVISHSEYVTRFNNVKVNKDVEALDDSDEDIVSRDD